MFQLRELFRNPSKELIEKQKAQDEERARAAKEVYAIARKCYDNDDFKRYLKALEYAEALYLESLLNYSNPDPVQYAFVMQGFQIKIREMKTLKDSLEVDLRKGVQKD